MFNDRAAQLLVANLRRGSVGPGCLKTLSAGVSVSAPLHSQRA
jgi:hypothetical protein